MAGTWRLIDPRQIVTGLAAATLLAVAMPGPAGAQDGCLPPGEVTTETPWAQLLLAPDRAWALSTGAGQRVAVLGTGIADHPQLADAVAARTDLAPEPEFGEPSGERDCLGLGTGVAGVVAAAPSDRVGFHGLAPGARLLDAKVVGDQFPTGREPGTVAPSRLASGIDWAIDQDATVIAVATMTYDDSEALATAVARALAADIVVVAPAGEADQAGADPSQLDSEGGGSVAYPAAYDGVVSVAVLDLEGGAWPAVAGRVDLVGPGADVLTTLPDGGHGFYSSSVFAVGFVAASVALLRAYRPGLSGPETVHQLLTTATPAPEGVGSPRYGFGIVDPYHAMVTDLVARDPATLPPYLPEQPAADELARAAAQERSDTLAFQLVAGILALAAATAAAVAFGVKGRRRRWRAGLAARLPERPAGDHPEPLRDLLSDLPPPR